MIVDWLRDIEQKVDAAAQDLINLRRSEKSLKDKVRRLEKALKESQSESQAGQGWKKSQALIRHRVENLIDGLERLDNS